jgi:hypothetical protein
MKNDLTTRTWQENIWCPIIIILLCTSDVPIISSALCQVFLDLLVHTYSVMSPYGTVGWRVASRTLGQGFKPLRCRIAPGIHSPGLGPHWWRVASRTLGQGFKPLRCSIAPGIRSQGLEPHLDGKLLLELLSRNSNPSSGVRDPHVLSGYTVGCWGPTCPIRVHLGVDTGKHTATRSAPSCRLKTIRPSRDRTPGIVPH